MIIHLDFETFSLVDIKKFGAYRYASDPSTEILMAAVAVDDEEPLIYVCDDFLMLAGTHKEQNESKEALELMELWQDPEVLVYAHNSQFELAVSHYKMLDQMGIIPPRLEQFRCTAAMCRRAAMPANLDKAGEALELDIKKDRKGKNLINKFSKLVKRRKKGVSNTIRIYGYEEPEAFREFISYCKQDVRTEREVHKKLSDFEMKGDTLDTFLLDAKINHRGIPVNVPALKTAAKVIKDCETEYFAKFRDMTGLNPTQSVKVKALLDSGGYPYKNMEAKNVDKALKDTSWAKSKKFVDILYYRKMSSYTATKKVTSMLACECGDGLVRGCHLYYGAGTGRWSAKLIQPQNFKRPDPSINSKEAFELICNNCDRFELEALYGNPLEVISSCIRHFIMVPNDEMLDGDYSSIEARIVCWLAGQEDALQRFRDKVDSYIDMATVIFSKKSKDISKDERWMGKQTVLGCGFGMGKVKFYDQCVDLSESFGITGLKITRRLAETSVDKFRKKYNKVANLWYVADAAARKAILYPGKKFTAGEKLFFCCIESNGIPFLLMKLPSGRNIVYPHPKIEGKNITFYGQIPSSERWGRISTYGAKLIENATQGIAADIMAKGADNAVKRGFDVFALIHDQALSALMNKTKKGFSEALTDIPKWSTGLPIETDVDVVPYYVKL